MQLRNLFTVPSIEIPPYQRSYAWKAKNVETLWNDVLEYFEGISETHLGRETDKNYFLGTIVLIAKGAPKTFLLLDGQQRLATLSIFLSVLAELLKQYQQKQSAVNALADVEQLLFARPNLPDRTLRLSLNREDRKYFAGIMLSNHDALPPADSVSHKYLKDAKELLASLLFEHMATTRNKIAELLRLRTILQDHLSFLTISVPNEKEAYDIFEHLNNRGVVLGLADLLRNMLFKKTNASGHEALTDEWMELLRCFPEGGGPEFSDLIRYSWISRKKRVARNHVYKAINDTIKLSAVTEYLNTLKSDARAYQSLTKAPSLPLNDTKRALSAFQVLEVRQCIPFLLAVQEVLPGDFERVLDLVNRFTLTFSTICNKNPNVLERTYCGLALFAREKKSSDIVYQKILVELTKYQPSAEEFKSKFGAFSTNREAIQKYILRALEIKIGGWKDLVVGDPDKVWVEHIYSQRPPAAEKWPDHGDWVNRLGNLSLLNQAENQKIGNGPFSDKARIYDGADLLITKGIGHFAKDGTSWTKDSIESRQKTFVESAWAIWQLPNSDPA